MMKKKGQKQQKSGKELVLEELATPNAETFEEEVNSGFGNYLRSAGGENYSQEMVFFRTQISRKNSGRKNQELAVTCQFQMTTQRTALCE